MPPEWLDNLLNRKKKAVMKNIPPIEEIVELEPIKLIPEETHEVIQQAIDAITNYIVREAQKKASQEGHPMEITPENVLEVINSGEIKIRIERE